MPGLFGGEIKAAFKKASTWQTAVACGANDGIVVLPTTIKKDTTIDIDDSMGKYFSKDGLPGPIKVEGDIPAYLRYDSLDVLIALYMGTAGAPSQQGGTAAYAYTYKVKTLLDGLFGTFVKHMKNYTEEHTSVKFTSITIKGDVLTPLQISFGVINSNKIVDSATNTTTTFNNNVTFFEEQNRVRYSEGVFRMNAQSGGALAGGDTIYPSSFELVSKRKMKGEYSTQYKVSATNQVLIDEPLGDGTMETTLKLTFPRHTGNTYLAALQADSRYKMDMAFTGALIAGSYYRQFKIQFPHLQLKNVDPADAQGNIKEPLEFIVHGATAAPTGMSGLTDPFWISGINRRTSDPLA